uniref:Uncharacterized protein n=1 Tax=Romanomermis culicivorax TaxID=13658 RepID=A0A915JYC4_ROMCU
MMREIVNRTGNEFGNFINHRHVDTITQTEMVVLLFEIILSSSIDPFSATELCLQSLGDIFKWANRTLSDKLDLDHYQKLKT